MAKAWSVVVGVAGLLVSGLGLLIGIGFAVPALGWNIYGPNPTDFTIAAEAVAVILYLSGAGICWYSARRLARLEKSRLPSAAVLAAVFLVTLIFFAIRGAGWGYVIMYLVFAVGLVLPFVLGIEPWRRPPVAARKE
jgi:hypothetical protein